MLILRVAPHQHRGPTLPGPCLGRPMGVSASQRRVGPVTGVGQHHPLRHALGAGGADWSNAICGLILKTLWPGELDRLPNPREDRAERRPAGSRARWLPTTTLQSDNCPACRVARNTATRRQRNGRPSSGIPCRRRSKLLLRRSFRSRTKAPAGPPATNRRSRQNSAAIDARFEPGGPRRGLQSARRSCARRNG